MQFDGAKGGRRVCCACQHIPSIQLSDTPRLASWKQFALAPLASPHLHLLISFAFTHSTVRLPYKRLLLCESVTAVHLLNCSYHPISYFWPRLRMLWRHTYLLPLFCLDSWRAVTAPNHLVLCFYYCSISCHCRLDTPSSLVLLHARACSSF
jgi:hypothetical protein